MARWALWMLIVTTCSTIVGGGGIFLVWRTLFHTRRAADYAQGMLRSERAWMIFQRVLPLPLGNKLNNDITEAISFGFIVENCGKSPAVNLSILTEIYKGSTINDINIVPPDTSSWKVGYGYTGAGQTFSGRFIELSLDEIDNIREGNLICVLYAKIIYKDIFGGSCETDISVMIFPNFIRNILEEKPFDAGNSFSFPYFASGPNKVI